jgi:hypothetical protein
MMGEPLNLLIGEGVKGDRAKTFLYRATRVVTDKGVCNNSSFPYRKSFGAFALHPFTFLLYQ